MCAFGCALLGLGLMLPPKGEIDSSVLVAYGETLTFAGAVIGIDWRYKEQLTQDKDGKDKANSRPEARNLAGSTHPPQAYFQNRRKARRKARDGH